MGCAAPSRADADARAVPLTWTGFFGGGTSLPGRVTLLLDEAGDRWAGTMFYETLPQEDGATTYRVTYRIEGAAEPPGGDGETSEESPGADAAIGAHVHLEQREILERDELPRGWVWSTGAYDLTLGDAHDVLAGSYESEVGSCIGTTRLGPVD